MKDKEKQIEEMAKHIDDRLIDARGYLGSMNKGEGYWIAQKLVEHYQPKLPEDSVVLSREELNKNYVQRELYEHSIKYRCLPPEFGKIVNEAKLQSRKETAEKIYSRAKAIVNATKHIVQGKPYLHLDALKEIIKSCGVEIKE